MLWNLTYVPTEAAANEARQMLGEKLRGMGQDPTNIQVVIVGEGSRQHGHNIMYKWP